MEFNGNRFGATAEADLKKQFAGNPFSGDDFALNSESWPARRPTGGRALLEVGQEVGELEDGAFGLD